VRLARRLEIGGPLIRLGDGLEVTLDSLLVRTEPYGDEPAHRNWTVILVILDGFRFLRGFDGMLGMDWFAQYARACMVLDPEVPYFKIERR
jgi:hypothetical protein